MDPNPPRPWNKGEERSSGLERGTRKRGDGLTVPCQYPVSDVFLPSLITSVLFLFPQVVTALGSTWHPEHFVCSHCQKEMGGSNFFEKDGAPYCERDYFQLFSPRCGLCSEPILDVSLAECPAISQSGPPSL